MYCTVVGFTNIYFYKLYFCFQEKFLEKIEKLGYQEINLILVISLFSLIKVKQIFFKIKDH